MSDQNHNNPTPSNTELAREAKITQDRKRQVELAEHPSFVVRRALAKNASLCAEALELLGDDLQKLRAKHEKAIGDVISN